MLEKLKSALVAENVEVIGEISSSLRTTLSQKQRNIDFTLLLEKGVVKRNQFAEKMLPRTFLEKNLKTSTAAALM